VKTRIQFTPLFTGVLLGASGWFLFWLFAFRPVPVRTFAAAAHPGVTRTIVDDQPLHKLKDPTLFAFPADEGFSGRFIGNRVDLYLSLEKPASPTRYLPQTTTAAPGIDRVILSGENELPQNPLPIPGATQRPALQPAAGIQLFPSPELKSRAGDALQLNLTPDGQPETLRVNLSIRADGSVEHALFETPVTNAALLSAVRQLRFKPAAEPDEGWIDIRFTQEEKK
jgi:hypothetical protein